MGDLFIKILNMSITASWIVLAVVILRFVLKKAPKWIRGVLWSLVALRLVFPFSVESMFSLIPSEETIPQEVITGPSFQINSGIEILNNAVNETVLDNYFEGVTVPAGYGKSIVDVISVVWIIGIAAMLIHAFASYLRVRITVRETVKNEKGIWICDHISTPFILGVFSPKIYLPSSLSNEDTEYVIAHEKAHLKRLDYIWKPLGFLILAFYWFNPVLWIAYILLCRDIELACDEKVINELGVYYKKPYSDALINCSVPRKLISACPLAFGEVGVKERIKGILNYKKPSFWVMIIAALACIIAAVCLLTSPKSNTLQNIEHLQLDGISEYTVSAYYKSGNNYYQLFAVENNLLEMLMDIEVSKNPVSQNRSEDRDVTNTLGLYMQPPYSSVYSDYYHLHFNKDFSEIWVDAGVKPTLSYSVKHPKYAKQLFNDIVKYGTIATTEGIEIENLKRKFPEYFDLPTENGLEVYIWQLAVNHYSCGLLPIKDSDYSMEELWNLKGTSMEQMRMILSTYNLYETNVKITPFANPISSYAYIMDDKYKEELEKRFWAISVSTDTFSKVYSDIKNALNKANFEFEEAYAEPLASGKLGFFNGTEKMYTLNLKSSDFNGITFYKFKSQEAAQSAKNGISSDGSSITIDIDGQTAATLISWTGAPHWYIYNDTLILYVGENNDILNIVESICGYSFAGVTPAPSANISDFNLEGMNIHYNYVGWHEDAFDKIFKIASMHEYLSLSSIKHFPAVKIESESELDEFITFCDDFLFLNQSYDEYGAFLPTSNKFDEDFFKEKSLIIIYADSGTGSADYSVKEISGVNDELFIYLDKKIPETFTEDMAGWFITIEMNKETLENYKYLIAR